MSFIFFVPLYPFFLLVFDLQRYEFFDLIVQIF